MAGIKVVGVGITPPVYKASGGISAGVQLMERVAALTGTRMYLMSDRDEDVTERGLALVRRRPGNLLRPFQRWLPKRLITLMWRPRIRRWLAADRPDVVHFHNPHPPGALLEAAQVCRQLHIPYVISTHGFVEMDDVITAFGGNALLRPAFERLIRRPIMQVVRNAAQVLMLSPQEEPILRRMGARAEQLSVVTNGVDPYFLEPVSESDRQALIARFELPHGVPLMLFVGNHTPNKGLDVLLRALPLLGQRCMAVVAGAITSRQDHERLLQQSGIGVTSDRLTFTDFITKDELRALYRSVDMFVFPSRADTLPLVILEAMACGLPVVSTTVGGIPYEVTADTGVLVPPGDSGALARAIDSLVSDVALRKRMGAAARARVQANFDWQASADKSMAIYRRVVAARISR